MINKYPRLNRGYLFQNLTNINGLDIIEETGSGVYHKYYETENTKNEIIGDKTKTIETISEDNSTTKRYTVNYYYSSSHEKNTDKFGRMSNERVYVTVYNLYSDTGTKTITVNQFIKIISKEGRFITSYKF